MAQTFHDTSVSQNKTPVKIFASSNLPFWQNKPIKFGIWTLLARSKEIGQFWGGWFGKQHSVLAQTSQSPSVSLTFQTKESNKISNLDPIRLLETNGPIFLGLIWKAGLSFCPNFAEFFSVIRRHRHVSFFCLSNFSFT